jgi:hypothetical protein
LYVKIVVKKPKKKNLDMNLQVFLLIVACVIGVVSAPPKRVSDPLKEGRVGADGTITLNEFVTVLLALHQGGSNLKIGHEDKLVWDIVDPKIKVAFEAALRASASADIPDTASSGRRAGIGAGFGSDSAPTRSPSTAPTPPHTADTAKVVGAFRSVEDDIAEAKRAESLARSARARNDPINIVGATGTQVHLAIINYQHLGVDATLTKLTELKSRGADFNIPNSLGVTPAHQVIMSGVLDERVFAALRSHGANFNILGDLDMTPADLAVSRKNPLALELLVRHGANLNIKSSIEDTPAHLAIKELDLVSLEALHKLGADFSIRDYTGKTVWDLMADNSNDLTPFLRETLESH